MTIRERIRNWWHKKFGKSVSVEPNPEIHITDDNGIKSEPKIFFGADFSTRRDESVPFLEVFYDGKLIYSAIPVLKFETFTNAKRGFESFDCDASCNPGAPLSEICFHLFEFKCPKCGNVLQFNIEEMELLAACATEKSVCFTCWENSGGLQKLAA
jgi:hypothetical protein